MFLKRCVSSLANPICTLFQRTFDKGLFPTTWKNSTLFPIFTSGQRTDVENYKGISLLPAIPKILESILTDDIVMTYKHYITDAQHGFFGGRSTATNLAVYQDFLITSLESGHQIDVVYTDFL